MAAANGEARGVPAAFPINSVSSTKEPLPSELLSRATLVSENTTAIEAKLSVVVRKGVPLLNSEMTVGEESVGFTPVAIGKSSVAVRLTFPS